MKRIKGDGVTIRDSIGRIQKAVFISESGLYSFVLSSKLPQAKVFKRWVTSEVLPQIRQTGISYWKVNLKAPDKAYGIAFPNSTPINVNKKKK